MAREINVKDVVIPTHFQRVLLRFLSDRGVCQASLMEGLGLEISQFIHSDCRINFEQHKRFVNNAILASQDHHIGWKLGRQVNVTTLGILGFAIMSSDNLKAALSTLTRFYKSSAPSYELNLFDNESPDSILVLHVSETFDFSEIRYFMLSSLVSAFDNVLQFLIQERNVIARVELACEEPEGWHQQAELINFPVIFNAGSSKIYFNEKIIGQTIPTADPDTERTSLVLCEQLSVKSAEISGFTMKVQQIIESTVDKNPTLADVAKCLCISTRTLRRELKKSNTSYQKILDLVRFNVSKSLLLNSKRSMSEIAFALGYKDPSNFNRAFRSWTGLSPGRYRQKIVKN